MDRQEGQIGRGDSHVRNSRVWNVISWVVIIGLTAVAAILIARRMTNESIQTHPRAWTSATQVAEVEGLNTSPALSPDGKILAASLSDPHNPDLVHLYAKPIENGDWVRVTVSPSKDWFPTWTPDGMQLGFVRQESSGSVAIYQIALLGGKERRILESFQDIAGFEWLADGSHLIIAERASEKDPYTLYEVPFETRLRTQISFPPQTCFGDVFPRVSPLGNQVAFVRQQATGEGNVMLLDLESRSAKAVTHSFRQVSGLSWRADGKALIFSAWRSGVESLWELPLDSGESATQRLVPGPAATPSAGGKSHRVVYCESSAVDHMEIYRLEDFYRFHPFKGWRLEKGIDHLAFGPNSEVFATSEATREGVELVLRNTADGSLKAKWQISGEWVGRPFWSPDSSALVVAIREQAQKKIYQLQVDEPSAEILWQSELPFYLSGWRGPGKALLISSPRDGEWQLWDLFPETQSWSLRTPHGGFLGEEISGTDNLVYSKRHSSGLWQCLENGDEHRLLTTFGNGALGPWAVHELGLFFVASTRHGTTLNHLDFIGKRVRSLGGLEADHFEEMSLSPDGKLIVLKPVSTGKTQLKLLQSEVVQRP